VSKMVLSSVNANGSWEYIGMKKLFMVIFVFMLLVSSQATAAWHTGTVTNISYGYDGKTVSFTLSGWTRTDCTCYSSWPAQMCLDSERTNFKNEMAALLMASATGKLFSAQINEVSCRATAVTLY